MAEKKTQAQSKTGNADPTEKSITISSKGSSLDPSNMIKTSGITAEHALIPKPIF